MIHEAIRIVLITRHVMFLEGLVRALAHEPEVDVVGTAVDVATAVAVIGRPGPQVVVVVHDRLPGSGGWADRAHVLRATWPGVALLMLTGAADRSLPDRVTAAGFAGLVTTRSSVADLVAAVRAISAGEQPAPAFGPCGRDLSPRELEALRLAAQGLTNRAIAEAMYLSGHTIKNYMQSAIGKLGAHSKLEAVTIAIREGLVTAGR